MAPAFLNPQIFRVRPDLFDQADHIYAPPLQSLPPICSPDRIHRQLIGERGERVRNQGLVPACTAVALAHLIDDHRLRQQRLPEQGDGAGQPWQPVSARMLFDMAKAFDELPDEHQQAAGSSLRGALRGFYHNGVCLADHSSAVDPELSGDWSLTISRAKQARAIVLGAYARVRHELLHLQAAVQQLGGVLVSANIHAGWSRTAVAKHGVIPFSGETSSCGHAFVIVGYTDEGFLVLNSQGSPWGGWRDSTTRWPGIALWLYEDWHLNHLDSWVIQLGVPLARESFFALGSQFGRDEKVHVPVPQSVNRIMVNGHYLHLNDGQYVTHGVYPCDLASIQETAHFLGPAQQPRSYRKLLLWVESGLDSLEEMMGRAAVLVAYLKRHHPQIYLMSVVWRRDVLPLTVDLLDARARRLEGRTRGNVVAQRVMLEDFAKTFLPPIWRTFEGEADRSFIDQSGSAPTPARGQGWAAMQALLAKATAEPEPLDVHVVAHSSGVVWVQRLARRLAELSADRPDGLPHLATPQQRRLRIRRVDLITPLITPQSLHRLATDLWGDAPADPGWQRPPLAVYQRPAERDQQEQCGGFPGSFLELAHRCFPLDGLAPAFGQLIPIAGHWDGRPALQEQAGLVEQVLITDGAEALHPCPGHTAGPAVNLRATVQHHELINDSSLVLAVLERSGLIPAEKP